MQNACPFQDPITVISGYIFHCIDVFRTRIALAYPNKYEISTWKPILFTIKDN